MARWKDHHTSEVVGVAAQRRRSPAGNVGSRLDVVPAETTFDTYGKEVQVTTAVAPSPQFTALDRCDRCGAQAYVRVELAAGGELLFCAHHAREHADKLQQVASAIQDETGRLTATRATVGNEER